MELQYRDIEGFVKKPAAHVLAVLVYGPDEGLVRERLDLLTQSVVEDIRDPFNVVEFSGDALGDNPARLLDEARLATVRVTGEHARSDDGELSPQGPIWSRMGRVFALMSKRRKTDRSFQEFLDTRPGGARARPGAPGPWRGPATSRIAAPDDKFPLVPFGEYMPFRWLLPLDKLAPGPTDFSAGPGPRTIAIPGAPPAGPGGRAPRRGRRRLEEGGGGAPLRSCARTAPRSGCRGAS